VEFLDKKIKELIRYRIEMFGRRIQKSHGFYLEQQFVDLKTKSVFSLPIIGREYALGDITYDKEDSNDENLFVDGNYFITINKEYREHIIGFSPEKMAWYFNLTGEIEATDDFRYFEEKIYPDGDKYPDF